MSTNDFAKELADTILEEIHETRRGLLKQHGGIAGLAAFLRQQEANAGSLAVTPEPSAESNRATRPVRKRRDGNS